MQVVNTKEGELHFPDSMSADEIKAVLRQKFPPKSDLHPNGAPTFKEGMKRIGGAITAGGDAFFGGWGDELAAGTVAGVKQAATLPFRALQKLGVREDVQISSFSDDYNEIKGGMNEIVDHTREVAPEGMALAELAGGVAGATKLAKVLPQGLTNAKTTLGTIGRSALGGLAGGASYGAGTGRTAEDRVRGGVIGGAMGATLGAAVPTAIAGFKSGRNLLRKTPPASELTFETTLPHKVRATKGQLSQDLDQQVFEDATRKSALGESGKEAKNLLDNFDQLQQEDFQKNIDTFSSGLGAKGFKNPRDAGSVISESMINSRDAAKAAVDAAYEKARQVGRGASVAAKDVFGSLKNSIKKSVESFDTNGLPQVKSLLREIDRFESSAKAKIKSVNVNTLETFRQRITSLTQSNDRVTAAAAQNMKSAYDSFLDTLIDKSLIEGDKVAIDAYKKARNLRANLGSRFETNKVLNKISKEGLTAEQTYNYVFGAGKLGKRTDSAKIIEGIENAIGSDSEGFRAMQEAGFLKLFEGAYEGLHTNGMPRISYGRVAQNVEEAFRSNRTMMENLFKDKAEVVKEIGRVARQISSKQPGAINNSNSANRFYQIGNRLTGGRFQMFMNLIAEPLQEAKNLRKAREAITDIQPKTEQLVDPRNIPIFGALSGYVGGKMNQ